MFGIETAHHIDDAGIVLLGLMRNLLDHVRRNLLGLLRRELLTGGRNQMVRVLYAQFYARLVFDQALHDKLLNDVLAADPVAPRLTLINMLAKRKAKALLESGKDYF